MASQDVGPESLPDGFDIEGLERGHEAMKVIVPSMEDVRLVVASDFTQAVRDSHPDRDYAESYEAERGDLGTAMAKTISQPDGRIDVILDSRVLASGEDSDVARTLMHEAYHIAIRQRGECLDMDAREHLGEAEAGYLRAAEIACEEFRVEAPLCPDSPSPHYKSFPSLLIAIDGHIRRLSLEYASSDGRPEDLGKISRGVGEQFGLLTTAAGYVAAVMEATGQGMPEIDPRLHRRLIGPHGATVLERLRELPFADREADVKELEGAVVEVADLLVSWIGDIGFRWSDVPGGLRFDVLKPAKWLRVPARPD
jgi:hypothetical protein